MTGRVYGWSTGVGGVHFFRIAEPLRVARSKGWDTAFGPEWSDPIAEQYDTLVVHMLWNEKASIGWEKTRRAGKHRMVYDIDDAMWATDGWQPFQDHYTPFRLQRMWRNIAIADAVTTPSVHIAEYVSRFNSNVNYVPNTVPAYVTNQTMRVTSQYAVGYQGSPSHLLDLTDDFRSDLARFLKSNPAWHVRVYGADPNDKPYGQMMNRFVHVDWQPNMRAYYRSLWMHIGLALGRGTEFNQGKSDLRYREYCALGIPGVYSAHVPAYRDAVENGVTGLLVDNSLGWFDAMHYLASDEQRRRMMAMNAKQRGRQFSTEANIDNWLAVWKR